MQSTAQKHSHPYIASRPDYCGGSAIIVRTRFPVRAVVNYVLKQGISPEELVKEFPLTNNSTINPESVFPLFCRAVLFQGGHRQNRAL